VPREVHVKRERPQTQMSSSQRLSQKA
jgi:hypothetical protein